MSKYINICNIYTGAWLLYYLQDIIYESGSLISQMLLLFLMFIGLYYAIKINNEIKLPIFFKGLNLFLIVMTIYGVEHIIFGKAYYIDNPLNVKLIAEPYYFIKRLYISLLPIYVYFYFSVKGYLTERWVKIFVFVVLIITTADFNNNYLAMLEQALYGRDEFTNNVGYTFLALIPYLVFFRKNRIIQLVLLCYMSFFIFSSMKRGAILILVFCILFYFYSTWKKNTNVQRVYFCLIISLFLGFIAYEIKDFLHNSDYFILRLENTMSGDSSSRDVIYYKLWSHLQTNADFSSFVFGEGVYSTVRIAGNYAHMDWLELSVNCGLVGLAVYVYFHFCFIKEIRGINDTNLNRVIKMAYLILLMESFFSMGYESIGMHLGLPIAFCLGMNIRNEMGLKNGEFFITRRSKVKWEHFKHLFES